MHHRPASACESVRKIVYLDAGTGITTLMTRRGAAVGFAPDGKCGRLRSAILAIGLLVILPVTSSTAEPFAPRECSPRVAERFVATRLNLWQERLKLDRWKISIVTSQQTNLRPNTLGNVRWYPNENSALIQVL